MDLLNCGETGKFYVTHNTVKKNNNGRREFKTHFGVNRLLEPVPATIGYALDRMMVNKHTFTYHF